MFKMNDLTALTFSMYICVNVYDLHQCFPGLDAQSMRDLRFKDHDRVQQQFERCSSIFLHSVSPCFAHTRAKDLYTVCKIYPLKTR
jgi:hypothetical protein